MFIIVLLHKRYTFNICIRFNDIIFYIHFVIQICIGYKRYDILLNHVERSTRPHDTIPRTVGRISSQTTGKSNFFGRKDITRDYLCILQVKTKHTIDQFHVVRYCFLNNALRLYGSYDCT